VVRLVEHDEQAGAGGGQEGLERGAPTAHSVAHGLKGGDDHVVRGGDRSHRAVPGRPRHDPEVEGLAGREDDPGQRPERVRCLFQQVVRVGQPQDLERLRLGQRPAAEEVDSGVRFAAAGGQRQHPAPGL
jgi:hypothetical protein